MNRLHDMLLGVIEDLNKERLVGVIGLDVGGWGYITMGPDIDSNSVPNDSWGFLLPQYYYYMPPIATTPTITHPPPITLSMVLPLLLEPLSSSTWQYHGR